VGRVIGQDISSGRHGFVRVPGADVHYMEAGEGPPLLLVHGLAASWRWWTPVLDALTRRHHVYAVDLPGFGLTRANWWFSLKSAGRFICEVMEALELERADLIGHSMGGRICMDVAAHCPERVRRLTLVSAVGIPWAKSYPEVGWDLLRESRATPREYLELVREDARRVRFFELALATYQVLADDFRDKLAQIQAPTLVVWGGRDILTPPEFGRVLAAEIPRAELALIEAAGHNPMWDDPGAFSDLVLSFLAGCRGAVTERRSDEEIERGGYAA
jgi:pimeloyl-ACP methyl ester carboxylesterase